MLTSFNRFLTKVGFLAHISSILCHALPQEALRLRVARTVPLPAHFGHRADHGKLSSRRRVGLEVLCCFIEDFHHRFAGNIGFLGAQVN